MRGGDVGVTRHLKYAWIEFGDTRDGQAFTAALTRLGWQNLFLNLTRKSDRGGTYYHDADHPLIPIRWKGNALLAVPNLTHEKTHQMVPDPIFIAYRDRHGEEALRKALREQNTFLEQWVFSPGLITKSKTQAALTLEGSTSSHADLVVISGHGSGGTVWGGDHDLGMALGAGTAVSRSSSPPKYVIVPACYNVSAFLADTWNPVLYRPTLPIRGVLGYGNAYPGGSPGAGLFRKFAENLKKNGGRKTILQAWKEAHEGTEFQDRWAAFLRESAAGDTMRDWLSGKLPALLEPDRVLWYDYMHSPQGVDPKELIPQFDALFWMRDPDLMIAPANRSRPNVGLIPGRPGKLSIYLSGKSSFEPGAKFTVIFYYFRPGKDGMDLSKLLQFDLAGAEGVEVKLETDLNREDQTRFPDGLTFLIRRSGLTEVNLPYTVHPDAHRYYGGLNQYGRDFFGNFWIRLIPPAPYRKHDLYQNLVPLRRPQTPGPSP